MAKLNYLFAIFLTVSSLFACNSSDETEEQIAAKIINYSETDYFEASSQSTSATISLGINTDWSISLSDPSADWVDVGPKIGERGGVTLTLTFDDNSTTSSRTQIITIIANEARLELTAHQLANDRAILMQLYYATAGDSWYRKSNWGSDAPLGEWEGVTYSQSLGSVTGLNFSDNNLVGTIPQSLGNLEKLTSLYLDNNKLSGEVPSSLFELPHIDRLVLEPQKEGFGFIPY